jgi:Transposase IS66 family
VLASLPEELRRAYRDGDFSVGIRDADFQVIPAAWVLAAEARWKPEAQIYGRQGVVLDRSTMADWVGRAAWLLRPLHERMFAVLKRFGEAFCR